MSSILLSNPFANPVPPSAGQQNPIPALAVVPLQGASAGRGSDNSTSFSGSNSGSDQQSTAALIRTRTASAITQPSNATSTSVVNAQTQDEADAVPFGSNLPKVAMPDPLPTSPFLKPS
ncbi:MAG: hypothetical protein ACSHXB_13985 [Sulfitobacter sp.]